MLTAATVSAGSTVTGLLPMTAQAIAGHRAAVRVEGRGEARRAGAAESASRGGGRRLDAGGGELGEVGLPARHRRCSLRSCWAPAAGMAPSPAIWRGHRGAELLDLVAHRGRGRPSAWSQAAATAASACGRAAARRLEGRRRCAGRGRPRPRGRGRRGRPGPGGTGRRRSRPWSWTLRPEQRVAAATGPRGRGRRPSRRRRSAARAATWASSGRVGVARLRQLGLALGDLLLELRGSGRPARAARSGPWTAPAR